MKVLVTEATRNASHGIVRALHDAGYQVLGSDYRGLAFNVHSRYAQAFYPSGRLVDADYADVMLELVSRTTPDVLVAGNQVGPFVANKQRFEATTAMLVPDYPAWQAAYYNDRTLLSCAELGVPCPALFTPGAARDYLREGGENRIMLKPRADLGGGQGLRLLQGEADLDAALADLQIDDYLFQEYIPGAVDRMRSVAVLYDRDSQLRLFFTSHKLRQWPRDGGICALGMSSWEPELVDLVQPFFEHWGWQGVAEVEFKIDPRDGLPKLIEINPRFWGHTGYAVQAGANFPVALCRLALGETVEQSRYRVGFRYIHWASYLRCIGADMVKGPGRVAAAGELSTGWLQPRARLVDWRDWRFTLAKKALEIGDALGR